MRSRIGVISVVAVGLPLLGSACFPQNDRPSNAPDGGGAAPEESSRPFVVNWSPELRSTLEAQASRGAVVVRREGERIEILARCTAAGVYAFAPSSHAIQTQTIESAAELGTKLPFMGPVDLGVELQHSGQLNIETHTVGEYRLEVASVHERDLKGACEGATHLVAAMTVGAFEFSSGKTTGGGAEASVQTVGVGGKASRSSKHLDRGGDKAACETASRGASTPPDRCDAVVAIEMLAIDRPFPFAAGETWSGGYACHDRKARARLVIDAVDDQVVHGVMHFDYGDYQGSYAVEGTFDRKTAETNFAFAGWKEQPPDAAPLDFAGHLSVSRDVFEGAFAERACEGFSLQRN